VRPTAPLDGVSWQSQFKLQVQFEPDWIEPLQPARRQTEGELAELPADVLHATAAAVLEGRQDQTSQQAAVAAAKRAAKSHLRVAAPQSRSRRPQHVR
jgi:hypothetical protein